MDCRGLTCRLNSPNASPEGRNGRHHPRVDAVSSLPSKCADAVAGCPDANGEQRFLGIDLGAETLKVVEIIRTETHIVPGRTRLVEHGKHPRHALADTLAEFDWPTVAGAAVTGRLGRSVRLPRIPTKQAQAEAWRAWFGMEPATLISIGSHGFSTLELRVDGPELYRENGRCSQGTGNFLRQLVERFGLAVEEASELCVGVAEAAKLSGRCPVILKTDMTHLANKGEDRAGILAGLFDAVCENVLVLVKPGRSPERVALVGGVAESRRVQRTFNARLQAMGFQAVELTGNQRRYLEATGAALLAHRADTPLPAIGDLVAEEPALRLESVPPLAATLNRVRRLAAPPMAPAVTGDTPLVAGFDVGSTGSKLVVLSAGATGLVWEGYRRTSGNPVAAAQDLWRRFLESPAARGRVIRFAVTGSGREIVGSLLANCYGHEAVIVLNEIVAHATGALHFDSRVDTIFEIGGQDAKYIRLEGGRVIDAAMNEACSAGTGSFIEEQGGRFAGRPDVVAMGRLAIEAPGGVSLGQHCSVFMAEVIDEAVAAGVDQPIIMAGLYDSIIQNYLNRVKGCRPVGRVVFCQGMPFAADALAAAVARQTGSEIVIPPNPGTVGALGIALLAARDSSAPQESMPDPAVFLEATVEGKDTFVCRATVGCGEPGNHCRIDRLRTTVQGHRKTFQWGGGCSLYDRGTQHRKLPDRAPDPFREREALIESLWQAPEARAPGPVVALSDEFMLKGLLPFFATFLRRLGCQLTRIQAAGASTLQRGIREGNVPFCAPMQFFQGVVAEMATANADFLFLPAITSLPRVANEPVAKTCPILQAGPEVAGWALPPATRRRVVSPWMQVDAGGLSDGAFRRACEELARTFGFDGEPVTRALAAAVRAQEDFNTACAAIGRGAIEFCAAREIPGVVVLGRPYTIYNRVLNSNAPALLREQGAVAIPIDCHPVDREAPVFPDMFWAYGQRILRAAHQVRRTPGVYAIYCSNYSCGPDSFNLHFCSHLMEGKPFAIIETDGHAGDAGTKTRIEAFLHCVREDLAVAGNPRPTTGFDQPPLGQVRLEDIRARNETVLVPSMGPVAQPVVACLRGVGLRAEALPPSDAEALRRGRRHTSGKECLPMSMTLGGLLRRVENDPDADRRFVFLMPRPQGPCRFGAYNLLNQIVLQRLGLGDRVRLWAPVERDYFATFTPAFTFLLISGFLAVERLQQALLEVRPGCPDPTALAETHRRHEAALLALLEREAGRRHSLPGVLWQAASGGLLGIRDLLRAAAADFARFRRPADRPTVLVAGEIYVRLDPFSNGNVIAELERRGLRVRLAPFGEWLEYVDQLHQPPPGLTGLSGRLSRRLHRRIREVTAEAMAPVLGDEAPASVPQALSAAKPYLRPELEGEAVLTLGAPLHEWRAGVIDALLSVGPLECMPNKIAEAQLHHVGQAEGLLSLTLSLNGEPPDPATLDTFAYEVHARFARRRHALVAAADPVPDPARQKAPDRTVPASAPAARD
ncbi:MAG: CoA activase [Verrucomicrobiales bacterium]|nr:CoA activase [Verrucomicrobiales bacterium]